MKFVFALLAALLFSVTPAYAQKVYNQAELDALLAPIALHPDGLLSQILIAATYPDEVAAAARWSRANPHLKGDDAVRAVQNEPWDPSVKALVAFPELLTRMDESPQWLHDLGEAFLLQEPHVMDTVQSLRRRAHSAGHLTNNEQYAVYQQGEAIVVQPRTNIVYVRYYDPYVVYGPWWWAHHHPVFWHPWAPRPVFVAHGFFFSKPDWHHRHVRVVHRPVHVHHHDTHVVPGKWQHRKHVVTKPYVRVPESQRRPIVQQHMPAVSGFSHQRKEVREHRKESGQRHLVAPPVRAHIPVPEAQRQPIVHSAPLTSSVAREAQRQHMPAASGFSNHRREANQHRERDHRSESRREHRKEFGHRQAGGLRKHRD